MWFWQSGEPLKIGKDVHCEGATFEFKSPGCCSQLFSRVSMDFQFWCLPRPLLRERRTYSQHGFETDTAVQQTYIVEITSLQPKKIHSHTKIWFFPCFSIGDHTSVILLMKEILHQMVNVPVFSGFYTSEVVQDFWTINGSVVWKKKPSWFSLRISGQSWSTRLQGPTDLWSFVLMSPGVYKRESREVLKLSSSKLTWQWKCTFSNRKYIFKIVDYPLLC